MDATTDLKDTPRLPAPRRFLADLIRAIAAIPLEAATGPSAPTGPSVSARNNNSSTNNNALRRVPAEHRALLATLHVLFPALLLPALDLLDRRRVVRFALRASSSASPAPALYHIRGDQAHVVHLRSWHCTCAFFALAAANNYTVDGADNNDGGGLGSAPRAFSTPPCKHLLACVLAEEWPALRASVCCVGDASDQPATPELLAGLVAGVL